MGQAERGALRVVVADDDEATRDALRLSLQLDERFRVVGDAADGAEAIDRAAAEQPDILLLDLRMPGLDGLAALPRIKGVAPATRVVVLSALPEAEMAHHAIAAGADAYLEKGRAMSDLPSWLLTLRAGWAATQSPA